MSTHAINPPLKQEDNQSYCRIYPVTGRLLGYAFAVKDRFAPPPLRCKSIRLARYFCWVGGLGLLCIRYPVIIKAAMGGGGRGMRVVTESAELEKNFQLATSEVCAYHMGKSEVVALT